jgi:hypothetical protein
MALREHIWPVRASSDEGKALAEVAAADWRDFQAHRAEELTPGGQLVLVIGAVNATGATGLEPMMDLANDILQALVAEGKLGAQAYAAMTIPSRPRSREEFTAPFDKGDIAELSLEELVIAETPNAAMLLWQQTSDAAGIRVRHYGLFHCGLRAVAVRDNEPLRELFAKRFTAAIARAPGPIARPLVTATLRVARR